MSATVSACLIVKNEGKVLDKCLASLEQVADEIIIVDTGSTDNTIEIAKKYTNKVFNYVWEDDFSKARNEGLKHATGKWIIVVDADEYIGPEHIEKYKHFFQSTAIEANIIYSINIISFIRHTDESINISEVTVGRIFPNNQGFYYYRPIHEQVTNDNDALRFKISGLDLYHTGYLKETVNEKNKSERNLAIFEQLKKQGKNFSPYDNFTLANEYHMAGDKEKAQYYYWKAFKKSTPNMPWRFQCSYAIYVELLEQNRFSECFELLEDTYKQHKGYPDYYYLKGNMFYQLGMYSLAKENALLAYNIANKLNEQKKNFFLTYSQFGSVYPLNLLLDVAKKELDYNNIIIYSTKLLTADNMDFYSLADLVRVLSIQASHDEVVNILKQIYSEFSDITLIILLRVAITLGHVELARLFYNQISNVSHIPANQHLSYALCTSQQILFETCLEHIKPEHITSDFLLQLLVAKQVWGKSYTAEIELINWNNYKDYKTLYECVEAPSVDECNIESIDANIVSKYLILLFSYKQFEIYDSQLNRFNHSKIINLLAQFFYKSYEIELAVSYFSVLLEKNELDTTSLMMLAELHIHDQLFDDAILFLKEIIRLNPYEIDAYTNILIYSKSVQEKAEIKQQLYNYFPNTRKIEILKSL